MGARLTGFDRRNQWHERAREIISGVFAERGFEQYAHGAELAEEMQEALRATDDRCSLMLRFRPDMVTIVPRHRSFLCEVKGYPPRHLRRRDEYCIEARAFRGMQEWDEGGPVVVLAVHVFRSDGTDGHTGAAWARSLPEPPTIMVPRRWDFEEQMEAMGELFPLATLRPCRPPPPNLGSGTPFIFVPRTALRPLDEFIDRELLGLY